MIVSWLIYSRRIYKVLKWRTWYGRIDVVTYTTFKASFLKFKYSRFVSKYIYEREREGERERERENGSEKTCDNGNDADHVGCCSRSKRSMRG